MPEHYAMDANVLSGTASLNGVKTTKVTFKDKVGNTIAFTKAPRIVLTLLNAAVAVPFKVKNDPVAGPFTGFILGFQNPVTLDVEWQALKRED